MLMEQRLSKAAKPKRASSGRASTANGSKPSAKAAATPSSRGSKRATVGGATQVRGQQVIEAEPSLSPRRARTGDYP